ncbi:hypothetical protein [Pseudoxanthomonas jiangsuensis]|uniref:hypothetical protein n=1 Tax=Pseudoxanthomonas jiangsuensis TaxID=619688 RepID=UPI001B877CBD|nr:hypothetical protein [Pseudoxanthomonas jiangsuensis]
MPVSLPTAALLRGCLLAACALGADPAVAAGGAARIDGVFWQPDAQTLRPHGDWHRLGAHTLVVQWTQAGEHGFVAGCGTPPSEAALPDWERIAREPWARQVILGLAGDYDETRARGGLAVLGERARCLVEHAPPVKVAAWYFPVEIDPGWTDAPAMAAQLQALPRPLWVSVYDNHNVGGRALAAWLREWLPADVGVLFQDGVGLHTREPQVAAGYLEELRAALGHRRVRLIVEAFRPDPAGGFRPATAPELAAQLRAYPGERVFLFEGPHYLDPAAVEALRRELRGRR